MQGWSSGAYPSLRTLRGGDRPKNAEEDPYGVFYVAWGIEPWGIFVMPKGMKVSEVWLERRVDSDATADRLRCDRKR